MYEIQLNTIMCFLVTAFTYLNELTGHDFDDKMRMLNILNKKQVFTGIKMLCVGIHYSFWGCTV